MEKPGTLAEYIELVDQALFEVEELRATVEYDGESMNEALRFLPSLEEEMRKVRQGLKDGSYTWGYGKHDLPFMMIVESQSDKILPFKSLLRVINHTHRNGLAVIE